MLPYGSRVHTLGRVTLLAMIPVNVVLVLWVWIGRIVFGVGGWFFLIFLVSVVPVLLVALTLTTVLAYTQHGRPRSLTGGGGTLGLVRRRGQRRFRRCGRRRGWRGRGCRGRRGRGRRGSVR